jgi:truncated hemoglobin YjbI
MSRGEAVTSLYDHAGGEEALRRLEELFYAKLRLEREILKAAAAFFAKETTR